MTVAVQEDLDQEKPPKRLLERHGKKITWSSIATVVIGGLSTGAVDMYGKWQEAKLNTEAMNNDLRPALVEVTEKTIPALATEVFGRLEKLETAGRSRMRAMEDRLLVLETKLQTRRGEPKPPVLEEEKQSPIQQLVDDIADHQKTQKEVERFKPTTKIHPDLESAKQAYEQQTSK